MKQSAVLSKIEEMTEKVEALDNKIETASATRNTGVLGAAPFARRGENIMGSRGFSFAKAMGALGRNGFLQPEDAKVELEYIQRFTKKCVAAGYRPTNNKSVLLPIAPDFFPSDMIGDDEYYEMKGLLQAGVDGADPNEIKHWSQKYGQKAAVSPALSWVDQSVGGAFVPPATFGPPIELLRSAETILKIATILPLGPTGRMAFPRLTAAIQGGWSGENTQQTPTTPTTGQTELTAKKVWATVALPGELLRFGSPAVEAVVRNDMFKTVALLADKDFLEGPGSNTRPLGLATMGAASGNPYQMAIVSPTNSNQLAPQDIYEFISAIEEQNGTPADFIMRPKLAWAIYKSRWTPYSGGTSQGGFMFDFVRGADGKMQPYLAGLPITRSTNVSKTRGSGSQTYVLCLNGSNYIVGMFGDIEWTQTDEGWTLLSSDQVAVRALLTCDGGPK